MTEDEYRANLAGLNTFFGAVLGFVLSAVEGLDTFRFAGILLLLAGIVVSILYISASPHRLLFAGYTLLIVLALPFVIAPMMPDDFVLPPKIQATLAVWTLMTIMVEFMPRERQGGEPPDG